MTEPKKLSLDDFKASLDRYKRIYPHIAEGRTDIEILLYRNLINQSQAIELAKPVELPKSNAGGAGKEIKPKVKKVRPYTFTQVMKICQSAAKDWIGDNPESPIEDCAYDMAEGLLASDERMVAYFKKTNIQKEFWVSSLADNFMQ